MDIPRPGFARKRLIRRIAYGSVALAVVPLITVGLSRLKPAAPTVELATVWPDTVKRGPMLRQVRGLGTLVPEEILWIPATTDGRVERILVQPGAVVKPDTVLLVLSNPELDLAALDAEYQVKAAEAQYTDLRVKLESQRLTQQADVAKIQSEYHQAKLKADRDEVLAREGLLPDLNLRLSQTAAEELDKRTHIEQERLAISSDSTEAQLAVQRTQVDKLRALAQLKRSQVQALHVRAGAEGVLQQVPVEVGQRVAAGGILAKVAQPQKLKAELKVPETQAKDVQLGQKADIDTRNGIILGRVSRIDPAVKEGTVTVDVRLEGELPQGARPDLSVDGTIEIERLSDVVYVGRPVFGQPNSMVSMLDRDQPPSDWKDDLRRGLAVIESRAEALSRFLEAYARLAKLPPPRPQAIDVALWVRRVAGLETRIAVEVEPGPEIAVRGDGDQLDQLLINLVRNAADAAMESGGRVRVGWRRSDSHLDVWVCDNGPGLSNTGNLFVPFFTTKPGGSGIGLILSRQIAEAHGGVLTLENRDPGPGCEARLRLPL